MAKALRVVLIIQQGVFRASLCSALEHYTDLEPFGVPSIPDTSFATEPDAAIIDLDFQPENHRELMRRMLTVAPNAKICIIAFRAVPATVRQCLSLGAGGFILKECTLEELYRAIKTVAAGEIAVDPRLAGSLLKGLDPERIPGRTPALSDREMEVIRLIALGLTNRQIATQLNLSEKTIKNHVSHIFRKLKITARTQAAIHAISHNLLRAGDRPENAPSHTTNSA
jgi:two-component system, NarL family, response regulator DegU